MPDAATENARVAAPQIAVVIQGNDGRILGSVRLRKARERPEGVRLDLGPAA